MFPEIIVLSSAWILLYLPVVVSVDIVIVMPTLDKCIYCCKIDTAIWKMELTQSRVKISCITKYEPVEPVCLNFWILQAGYFTCR